MRRICYVTGTRADFGLMRKVLQTIHGTEELELSVVVTGMHLDHRYGFTVTEVEAAGLPIAARIDLGGERATTGATMARNIGHMIVGMVDAFERIMPDVVLLLGDRGEMLAGAVAAVHLNIHVVHIHGGERSGTVDESVRHAISKLSHYHFVATEESRNRLIRMGEDPERIHVTGAPGLDGIEQEAKFGRDALVADLKLDGDRPIGLFVFHPVVQEAYRAGGDTSLILDCLMGNDMQVVALKPNSDAGSGDICRILDQRSSDPSMRVVTHLPREVFVSWMAVADLMVGNSSSGIIEASSFGTPVINVGSRQNLRERNTNIINVELDPDALDTAVKQAIAVGRYERRNIYGDGNAYRRITNLLRSVPLDHSILLKSNVY